ncbi:unnamed protein product [Sphacelaria rigidula]
MAIKGDELWPQTAKREEDEICRRFSYNVWNKRSEHLNVGGVLIKSRNGARSRKGCVVNGQTTTASNE